MVDPTFRLVMAMIDDIVAGLEILKVYNSKSPLVAQAYYLSVPGIKASDVTGPGDAAALAAANWLIDTERDYYYYKAVTITEIKYS